MLIKLLGNVLYDFIVVGGNHSTKGPMISSFLSKTLFKVAYEFSNKSEKKTNALMANEFYQQKILKLDV